MNLPIILLCLIGGTFSAQIRYDDFQVHRITPKTISQVMVLKSMEENEREYLFWNSVSRVNKSVDVMVPPHLSQKFGNFLTEQRFESFVLIKNVQEKVDSGKAKVRDTRFGWTDYYPLDEIYAWLDDLAVQYPQQATVIVGGKTYEGREIKGVRVSFSPENANNVVFIEAGIHAREWIAPATATYILNEVLSSTDPEVRATVEKFDWYVFPVFNPDGYVYTHTNDRMWRKTRVPYANGCYGADPNRNWPYEWNHGGASNNPCTDNYCGPEPFSEPETKSTSEFIASLEGRITAYISFHSASQILAFPYGHTTEHLGNYDEVYDIGIKAAESLAVRYGTKYTVGNIGEAIYIATGGSGDWVKGTYSTPLVYTYELRDTGEHGFLLPPEQIIPSGEETFDSVKTILDEYQRRL